ncbi:hypothetical protein CDAR_584301 [Caerostris darwini]|uniref:Uncharacterized protein n=1 Tax=Caerostris darwini TaxID=1538125 RepID=A0AAV4WFF7_9ARAC|nr:hypothetical protein CDAR_584301 [Caerostris darwini]
MDFQCRLHEQPLPCIDQCREEHVFVGEEMDESEIERFGTNGRTQCRLHEQPLPCIDQYREEHVFVGEEMDESEIERFGTNGGTQVL